MDAKFRKLTKRDEFHKKWWKFLRGRWIRDERDEKDDGWIKNFKMKKLNLLESKKRRWFLI